MTTSLQQWLLVALGSMGLISGVMGLFRNVAVQNIELKIDRAKLRADQIGLALAAHEQAQHDHDQDINARLDRIQEDLREIRKVQMEGKK